MSKFTEAKISEVLSSSDDELKPHYIDSSQSDSEKAITSEYHDTRSYVNSLAEKSAINLDDMRADSNELKQQLGLVLHHYADRVFNSSELQDAYKESKSRLFDIGEETYNATVNNISGFLQKHVESEGNIFTDPAAVINLAPKKKIQLFNYIFNEDVALPEGVDLNTEKINPPKKDARSILLEGLRVDEEFKTAFLRKGGRVTLTNAEIASDAKSLLVYANLVQRANRNQTKDQMIAGRFQAVTHSVEDVSNSRTSEASYTIRPSGKVQGMMNQLSNYNDILKNFGSTEHKQTLASGIKKYVTTGEMTSSISERDETTIIDISHLLFGVEVIRNRATMFTAPMFIDKMIATGQVTARDFPMSIEGAVDAVRDIRETYKDNLPNTRGTDLGKSSKRDGDKLLKLEGESLVSWLDSQGKSDLNNAIQLIDCKKDLQDLSLSNPKTNNNFIQTMNTIETVQDQLTIEQKLSLEPYFGDLTAYKNSFGKNSRGVLGKREENKFTEFTNKFIPILDERINQSISREVIVEAIGSLNTEILISYYDMQPEKILDARLIEASSISPSVAVASNALNVATELERPSKKLKMETRPSTVANITDSNIKSSFIQNEEPTVTISKKSEDIADGIKAKFEEGRSVSPTNVIKPPSSPKKEVTITKTGPSI